MTTKTIVALISVIAAALGYSSAVLLTRPKPNVITVQPLPAPAIPDKWTEEQKRMIKSSTQLVPRKKEREYLIP